MVVGVAVGQDDRAQVAQPDLQDVHVVDRGPRAEARVVEDRRALAAALDGEQQREAVLGQQLRAIALQHPVVDAPAAYHLAARQEQVDGVVDQDGHLDRVHGLKRAGPGHADRLAPIGEMRYC